MKWTCNRRIWVFVIDFIKTINVLFSVGFWHWGGVGRNLILIVQSCSHHTSLQLTWTRVTFKSNSSTSTSWKSRSGMANSPLQETFSWCSSRLTPVCRWISNQADLHLKTTNNSVRKALAIGQASLSVIYSTQTIPIHELRTLSCNKGWWQATSNN